MTTDEARPSPRPPDIALFAGIDPALVSELLWTLPVRTFAAGEYLCHEGEPGSSMFILRRGLARVVIGPDETSVRRLRRGDVVGEMSMLTNDPRTASVIASVPTEVLELDRNRFASTLSTHPELLSNLTRILSERLARTTQSGRTSTRGEAIALVVGEGLEHVAAAVIDAVETSSPANVASIDLRVGPQEAGDRLEEALSTLDDLLAANRTVTIVTPADFGLLDLLTLHTDRTLVLTHEDEADVLVKQVAPDASLTEVVLVDAEVPAGVTLNGVPVIRTIWSDDERHARWVGRHLARTKIGLALGAGGAKGYAHVGALRVLEQAGYEIDYVSGSSIGAVVGVCVALGMDSLEIEAMLLRLFTPDNVKELFTLSFAGTSTGGDTMKAMLSGLTDDKTFADLRLPMTVMTVDLGAREPEPIMSGPLLDALLAATALAGFVPPFKRGEQRLIDALALVPVPSEAVRTAGADVTISVNIMSRDVLDAWPGQEPPETVTKRERMLDTLLEVMDLGQLDASIRSAAAADVPITPVFGPATWRDFELADLFLEAGTLATTDALDAIAELVRPSLPPTPA